MVQSASTQPKLEIVGSRQFTSWLISQNISLAFTTYQAGKIFWIGIQPDGRLSVFERTLERSLGLWVSPRTLYLSSLYQIWRFENALPPGQNHNGYDALYVPQLSYVTGDLDVHDVAVDNCDRLIFVNTLFSCLATVSDRYSFTPLWKPPFISRLAAEDRCHLNGLAMRDGQPHYVTAVSQSDVNEGWRDRRHDGGCLIDIIANEILVTGLSMPHSPRWYRDRLWLLNSGTGEFGWVDVQAGKFEPVAFCPGYLRGCTFAGDYAIVGISKPRENRTFSGLALDERLQQKQADSRCGLLVIHLNSGDIVHSLRVEGIVTELYDVAVIPGIRRPMAIGFRSDEIRRFVTLDDRNFPN